MIARALALVVVTAWATGPARGDGDRESRARAHYEVGLGMYHLGNYADAVREFSAGWELSHRPQFLVNLGQAYRKLGELDKAAEMFRQYLAVAPADASDRQEVQDILREVEQARAAGPTASTSPSPAPAPAALVASRPPATKKSALRRLWWTIPVGAVVVGAALGVGLYFGLSQGPCTGASIGCYDLRK